jgi:PAB-dependent poly(A)-specific ribonuclease subunit 3
MMVRACMHVQQEDLVNFGRLILLLASNSLMALQRDQFQASMDGISRNYSSDVKNLVLSVVDLLIHCL